MIKLSRVGVVHGAFVCFAAALIGRAAWVQLGQSEEWRSRARGQQVASAEVPAVRGAILDASGRVLVESRAVVRLAVAPNEVRDPQSLAEALRRARVPDEFVRRAIDRNRKWVELPGQYLSTDVASAMAMRGVHATASIERVAPPTDGLRRLLGGFDARGNAVGGVEAALDSLLRGQSGRRALLRDGRGRRMETPEERSNAPVNGHSVVLTLNQGLQDIAERALAQAVSQMDASGGDIVILDPHTGELRALASRRQGAATTGATALTEPYEPGSTIKPFIAAALLERGRVQMHDSVPTYNGVWRIGRRTISDVHKAKAMSFAEVILQSSNIGIVQFAERLTPREQYETLRDAGFGTASGLPYPSESPGRLYPVGQWSGTSQASLAMGYELSVTPVQLAAAYASFANGGLLVEPQLVQEIRGPDGRTVWRAERRVVRRMMSEATSFAMRDLLRDVVQGGTATSANLATFEVAGKSGTARRTSADGRGYEAGAYTASFVGLFPADDPQYVILVKLDNPKAGSYYGGRVAAPVSKVVLEAAIAARDASLNRTQLAEAPKRRSLDSGRAADSVRALAEADAEAERAAPAYVVELGSTAEAAQPVVTTRPVPDVRGLPTRRAVRELHRAGFRVQVVSGVGVQPAPGTMLRSGSLVRLGSER
ncbi:MAG TPA: penicillin-binding transpeptidase domain-containing protein [Gemmatimonadaceae bacterium]|nr:penicillin-binding transpeptidase domain-containing protein [Gemmatimonadaceae bacterium]